MPKKKEATKEEVIKGAAEELLQNMDIGAAVLVTPTAEEVYLVNVETEESGLLIGYHGDTLAAYQLVLGQIVTKRVGEWVRIVVEVGDYRAKREEQLKLMAESYAEQVVTTGQPIALPSMPPIERRIVHMALQDHPDVMTESEGEGNFRHLVISLKKAN